MHGMYCRTAVPGADVCCANATATAALLLEHRLEDERALRRQVDPELAVVAAHGALARVALVAVPAAKAHLLRWQVARGWLVGLGFGGGQGFRVCRGFGAEEAAGVRVRCGVLRGAPRACVASRPVRPPNHLHTAVGPGLGRGVWGQQGGGSAHDGIGKPSPRQTRATLGAVAPPPPAWLLAPHPHHPPHPIQT